MSITNLNELMVQFYPINWDLITTERVNPNTPLSGLFWVLLSKLDIEDKALIDY